MKNYENVLVVSAHPDDLEISAGGTVSKLTRKGVNVDNLIMVHDVPHKKYVEASSKWLGFNPIFLDFETSRPRESQHVIAHIELMLDIPSYDLIITQWREDWHQDHRMTHYVANSLRRKGTCDVWYMDAWPYNQKYEQFRNSVYVDITEDERRKRQAIREYKNVPSSAVDKIRGYNAYRGDFINSGYAEVFSADTIILR